MSVTQRLRVLRLDSIRNKILAFAILATLLPSLATAWISYLENRRSLSAKASEELLGGSMQTVREVDLWSKERRYDLRVFASSYEVTDNLERIQRDGGRAPSAGRAQLRLTNYLRSVHDRFADFAELLVVDARGRVVASSREQPGVVELPPAWQSLLRDDRLLLGRPYWNEGKARPEAQVALPIGVAGDGSPGAITARVNLEPLVETLRRFAPGESGQVHLVGEDGDVLISSRETSPEVMSLRYPQDEIRSRLAGEGRPVEYVNGVGQQVLGSTRPVPGQDWLVVAEIPLTEVFGALDRLRNVTLMIVAGMLVVAGALGYALGLFIIRPLDRLTRAAARVARGELDVDPPVATGGEVGYLTEVFNNMVARLRASHAELERLAVTDYLTGLNNRRRMMEVLENEVLRSHRLKHTFSVVIADLDNFKQYNDAHGHPAGDEVLKRVAVVLREATRDVDFVARYGGEEFFILMPELEAAGAVQLADRIRKRLARQVFADGPLTLSMGVAAYPGHGTTGDALVAAADAALYEAKHAGRDRLAVAQLPPAVSASGR
ncbi:MAG: sensor domain-containing diguanylate cyclase [Gammaproteobacteria bacterium]